MKKKKKIRHEERRQNKKSEKNTGFRANAPNQIRWTVRKYRGGGLGGEKTGSSFDKKETRKKDDKMEGPVVGMGGGGNKIEQTEKTWLPVGEGKSLKNVRSLKRRKGNGARSTKKKKVGISKKTRGCRKDCLATGGGKKA